MTLKESQDFLRPLMRQCLKDDDMVFVAHFSRSEDRRYQGATPNMDAGDAFIIIKNLIEKFHLSAEAIANMESEHA